MGVTKFPPAQWFIERAGEAGAAAGFFPALIFVTSEERVSVLTDLGPTRSRAVVIGALAFSTEADVARMMTELLNLLEVKPNIEQYFAVVPFENDGERAHFVFEQRGGPTTYWKVEVGGEAEPAQPEFTERGIFVSVLQGGSS